MKYFLGFIMLIIVSCTEEPVQLTNQPSQKWKKLLINGELAGSIKPIIYEDAVIYSRSYMNDFKKHGLVAFNKKNGKIVWEWNDFFTENENIGLYPHYKYQNVLVFTTGGNVYAVNMIDGTTIWKTKHKDGGVPYIRGFGEILYHTQTTWTGTHFKRTIVKSGIYDGNWEEVWSVEGEGDFEANLNIPLRYIAKNGDEILVIIYSLYNFNTYERKAFLMFYNQTKALKEKEIEMEDISTNSASLYLNQNVLYISGQQLKCFDLERYDLLWETDKANVVEHIENDILITRSSGNINNLKAINANTQQTIWETTIGSGGNLIYYSDIIYLTGGGNDLSAINANTGEKLWTMESPDYMTNSGAYFASVVTIDPETNRLYTANYLNALCYQLE